MEIAGFILALVAFGLSLINAYKTWWEKAKLEAIPASSIELTTGMDRERRTSAIRLSCNFVNPTGRLATLQHLELEVRALGGPRMGFVWKQFASWQGSGEKVDVIPVVVGAHDSEFLSVVFKPVEGPGDVWASGRYSVTLKGWMNLWDRRAKPNVISRPYHLTVSREEIEKNQFITFTLGFEEWSPPVA